MDKLPHGCVTGIDVSCDWLDLHCLPSGLRRRLPNAPEGHAAIADLARDQEAVVCFEATGGQEWRLWAALDAAGSPQEPTALGADVLRLLWGM